MLEILGVMGNQSMKERIAIIDENVKEGENQRLLELESYAEAGIVG
jgi:hypothetical protein